MSGKHEKNIAELEAAIARMKADLARNTVPEDARKGGRRRPGSLSTLSVSDQADQLVGRQKQARVDT
jgi:hypothetical protein